MLKLIFSVLALFLTITSFASEKLLDKTPPIDIMSSQEEKSGLELWKAKFKPTIEEMDSQIGNLGLQLWEMKDDIKEINGKIYECKLEISEITESSVRLDFKDPSAQKINTEMGSFFLLEKEAIPYLNGYKILFQIGNPYFATFSSLKLNVRWSVPFSQVESGKYSDWYKTRKEKEFSVLDNFPAGSWTLVELILIPCKVEELQNVLIELKIPVLSLKVNEKKACGF